MPVAEISAAITSIKIALDIVKGIRSLDLDVAVKEKTSALNEALISVQNGMLALQVQQQELLELNQQLSKKLLNFEEWKKVESQYDLIRTSVGSFVRAPNSNHPSPNPIHWCCANCFDKKIKSILQKTHVGQDRPMICPECKTYIFFGLKERDLFHG